MNPWPFIVAGYGITAFGTIAVVLWSYLSMRSAEKKADDL